MSKTAAECKKVKTSTKIFKSSCPCQFCTVQPETPERNLNFKDKGQSAFRKAGPSDTAKLITSEDSGTVVFSYCECTPLKISLIGRD